jgi:hypothetical protein
VGAWHQGQWRGHQRGQLLENLAGKGAAELVASKVKLRRQALDWLKAELAAWSKILESGPPQARPVVASTLEHWKEDSDVAGIRDAAALDRLPQEERAACKQLWADVDGLLSKVEFRGHDDPKSARRPRGNGSSGPGSSSRS